MEKIKRVNKSTRTNIAAYGIVIVAFAILFPLQSAGMISNFINGQLVPICTYIVMAISLNLTVGFLGELSLGHAGFMSVGAFTGTIVAVSIQGTVQSSALCLLIAIIVGGLIAGIAGLIIGIPVLRLRGDYLAIVTLAFGEIIKNIINCLYVGIDSSGLHMSMTNANALGMMNGRLIINGPQGTIGVTKIATFTAGVLLILFALFIVLNLVNSKTGRAVTAIRDNRIAAESVGISITRYKLTAFIISAILAGMAGALYAMNFPTVAAKKFDFNTSILILVFVVLGGRGNIVGSIIATIILYMLPELLREFADYRMLIYAIVLVLVMLATNSERGKYWREQISMKLFRRGKLTTNKQGETQNE
jgi:branched-chain amino acid transport system permease protein